jgi:hypothetical protein
LKRKDETCSGGCKTEQTSEPDAARQQSDSKPKPILNKEYPVRLRLPELLENRIWKNSADQLRFSREKFGRL